MKHEEVISDLERLKQVYDKEKIKSKALEEENSQQREDLLKIKSEKHKLSKNMKVKNDDLKALQAKLKP